MPVPLFSLRQLLLALLAVITLVPSSAHAESTSPVFKPLPARQQLHLSGFTRAGATLDIIPEVSGRCLEIKADIGETVPDNGIFAVIDSTLIALDLRANQAGRQHIERTLRFNTQQVERYRRLLSAKSSSRALLDEQELQRDQSEIKLNQLGIEEERLQELLSRHVIKAPPGWKIMTRSVEPGQWLSAGQVIARAGDFHNLLVPLAVTPSELHSLQQAKRLAVRLPDEDINGFADLYRISPAFDPVSRKINIELLIAPETYSQLPLKQGGIRVEVPVLVPDPFNGFLVPASAVAERFEEHWLTRKNGQQIRVVVLGPEPGPEQSNHRLHITSPDIRPDDLFLLAPSP